MMKYAYFVPTILLFMIILFFTGSIQDPAQAEGTTVSTSVYEEVYSPDVQTDYFSDENLEVAVRKWLGRSEGEAIEKVDIEAKLEGQRRSYQLQGIDLSNKGITDLQGLEIFQDTNIKYLNLSGNNFEDVSPLTGLTTLNNLYLDDTPKISDVSALSNMQNLQVLSININRPDLSPQTLNMENFPNLSNVMSLGLAGRKVSDITALQGMILMERLDLNNNLISIIEGLKGMTQLKSLTLRNNAISDLSPLYQALRLESLSIDNNHLSDISVLGNMANLKYLTMSFNRISDISSIKNNSGLENLQIIHNPIDDISALNDLVSLQTFMADSTFIEDIGALKKSMSLKYISIADTLVNDLSVLSDKTELTTLLFPRAEITDISPLTNLNKLNMVRLDSNYIDLYSEGPNKDIVTSWKSKMNIGPWNVQNRIVLKDETGVMSTTEVAEKKTKDVQVAVQSTTNGTTWSDTSNNKIVRMYYSSSDKGIAVIDDPIARITPIAVGKATLAIHRGSSEATGFKSYSIAIEVKKVSEQVAVADSPKPSEEPQNSEPSSPDLGELPVAIIPDISATPELPNIPVESFPNDPEPSEASSPVETPPIPKKESIPVQPILKTPKIIIEPAKPQISVIQPNVDKSKVPSAKISEKTRTIPKKITIISTENKKPELIDEPIKEQPQFIADSKPLSPVSPTPNRSKWSIASAVVVAISGLFWVILWDRRKNKEDDKYGH